MANAPTADWPLLRQELRIETGAPDANGAPCWTLFDPLRNMFFQLGRIEYLIFRHWANDEVARLGDALESEGVTSDELEAAVSEVVEFGISNNLVTRPAQDVVEMFSRQRQSLQKSWWHWMVDNYLFMRIPLVKPANFLRRTLPRVEFLFSRTTLVTFALAALIGLYMVSRQWDAFMGSFLYFFSAEGLVAYGLGIAAVKVIHELGHAYMATRFGCRVPAMGVALLVMMPVLYTDTTSAWRLKSRKQRLLIDCAGMMAELGVATIATWLWVLLPDGPLRSIAFVLATTSWVMSLAINISPFMRFDGYYVLSDATGIPNLQPRAFVLGRWRLREFLFGLGDAPPEELPRHTRRWMIAYAYATWVYRLILFLGIALLVYHLFFKLLGLVLFIVEIIVFVARPIAREIRDWYAMKDRILAGPRWKRWAVGLGVLTLLLVLPFDMRISAPALLSTVENQPLVAGDPAQLEHMMVSNGQAVKAGMPVAILASPDIERDIARARVRIAQLEAQTGRAVADLEDRNNLRVLASDLAGQRLALAGLMARRKKLTLVAPADGMVTDVAPDMVAGRWLSGQEPVVRIISPGRYDIQAYVKEDDLWRLEPGASARFVPNDATKQSFSARLLEISTAAAEHLALPMLGSPQGGAIAVNEEPNGRLKPREAIYRVYLTTKGADRQIIFEQNIPGVVMIRAKPSSAIMQLFRGASKVWQSEQPI